MNKNEIRQILTNGYEELPDELMTYFFTNGEIYAHALLFQNNKGHWQLHHWYDTNAQKGNFEHIDNLKSMLQRLNTIEATIEA